MAVDATTVILTAMFTGVGVSIGNSLFEIFLKDYFKKLKSHKKKMQKLKLLHYKRPWLASLLNFFIWGSGYLYIGRKRTVGILVFLIQTFIIGAFSFEQNDLKTTFEGMSYSLMLFLIGIYLSYDAFKTAKSFNRDTH